MKREQAIEIACRHAEAEGRSYYGEGFVPHDWVVDAILEAADKGALRGASEALDEAIEICRAHADYQGLIEEDEVVEELRLLKLQST